MADILTYYYIPLLEKTALTISGVEESLEVTVNGFHLRGRLDSIEQRGSKTFIVDFKTGANEQYLTDQLRKA